MDDRRATRGHAGGPSVRVAPAAVTAAVGHVAAGVVTRREALLGGLVLGLGGASSLPAASIVAGGDPSALDGLPDFDSPEVSLRQIVRMQGSLREEDVPWWFTGVIFAVTGDRETPRPLVRFEGLEIYWFSHQADGYFLGGHTVTFFRDYATGAYLYEYRNPWTGATDVVKPAVQGGGLGFRYSTRGIWPARYSGEALGPLPDAPLALQWHAMRDAVWLQHQTVYPPGVLPMHGQRQTMFAPRRDVLNRRLDALPSVFSSTVFMGWLKWMNMGDRPGHVVWHASGAKLRSIADLPPEFRARAEKEYPERMTARPPPA